MNGHSLFPLLVTQTLQVTLLASIVLALTKSFAKDRPHLAHALWALVLLKCLMPPIIASPTSVFSWLSNGYAAIVYKTQQPPTENEQSRDSTQSVEGIAPVIVRISPKTDTSDALQTQPDSPTKTDDAKIRGISLVAIALSVWIAIAACVFAVSGLRLWIFLRRVRRATLPNSPSLSRLVESVSKRIGLRRKVQIRTVDAAIGPAVVGLIWPTILMPKVIVEDREDAELEPLLAHELIHVRRGDLVWAMLQATSVSLWWFNPLVWLAQRLLTREAERSCDEETIAGLGCNPTVYARSLLDVMERKHQLRAAPSLPGVRPVDITAKRLERIMRLGHGCYRQRPWWVVVVWLIGCAIALPGAAWVTAQEEPKREPSVFKEAGFNSETFPQTIRPPRTPAGGPVAQSRIEAKSFLVADVIKRLCKERTLVKADAEKELIRMLQPNAPAEPSQLEDIITIALKNTRIKRASATDENARQTSSTATDETIKIVGEQIYANATADQLKQIEGTLEQFREYGFKQLVTKIEFYEIPRQMFEENNVLNEKLVFKGLQGLSGAIIFEEAEIAKFKQWLENENNKDYVVYISSPRITALNGQLATVQLGELTSTQAADGEAEKHAVNDIGVHGKRVLEAMRIKNPIGRVNDDGKHPKTVEQFEKLATSLRCETRAVLIEPTNNGEPLRIKHYVDVGVSESTDNLKQESKHLDKQPAATQYPIVHRQSCKTSFELSFDQTVVVVLTNDEKTFMTMVRCQPFDATVPHTDLDEISNPAYVCVSDALSDFECALLKHKLQELGIRDFRIDDGRMQVNVNEEWKAAVSAYQELRSKRDSTLAPATSTKPSETRFRDGNTAYAPIMIMGPIGQKEITNKIPILSDLPYIGHTFKQTANEAGDGPSSDEIFAALAKQQAEKNLAPENLNANQIKISKSKIAEFSDAKRFIPLIGEASLHHVHYKCLLHDSSTQELKSLAYIDYCYFELAEAEGN